MNKEFDKPKMILDKSLGSSRQCNSFTFFNCPRYFYPPTGFYNLMNAPHAQSVTETTLLEWFASGEKPAENCLIGSEHEKFLYNLTTLNPATYTDIAQLLSQLHKNIGGEPIIENENIIGIQLDKASITLEPGGQLELSGAPLNNLHQTCNEIATHIYQMQQVCQALNLGMLGIGHLPDKTYADMPKMPKQRYNIMRRLMPKAGPLGLDMMHLTTTIQVNLDYLNEQDMAKKMRIAACLQTFGNGLIL